MNTCNRIIRKKEGFTLAELLIVVAIVAILVAIALPNFFVQLEKSRESLDEANLRTAYAKAAVDAVDGINQNYEVVITQREPGWRITPNNIGGINMSMVPGIESVVEGDVVLVGSDKDTGEIIMKVRE